MTAELPAALPDKQPGEHMFPVAEIFRSIQGEGQYAGSLMTFVRFGGCNVGKPYTAAARETLGLNVYQERCTDWGNNSFACDTNYRRSEWMSATDILEHALVREAGIVLLTGGEPLMHRPYLDSLINKLLGGYLLAGHSKILSPRRVHVETSGTKEIGSWIINGQCWVCVSPKQGCLTSCLYHAHEVKVLVGDGFDETLFLRKFASVMDRVWVQPVNYEHDLNFDHLRTCIDLVHRHNVRLSTQLHKIWKVR